MAVANKKPTKVKSKDVMEHTSNVDSVGGGVRERCLVELKDRLTSCNGDKESSDIAVNNNSCSASVNGPIGRGGCGDNAACIGAPVNGAADDAAKQHDDIKSKTALSHARPPVETSSEASASLSDFNAARKRATCACNLVPATSDQPRSPGDHESVDNGPVNMKRPFRNIGTDSSKAGNTISAVSQPSRVKCNGSTDVKPRDPQNADKHHQKTVEGAIDDDESSEVKQRKMEQPSDDAVPSEPACVELDEAKTNNLDSNSNLPASHVNSDSQASNGGLSVNGSNSIGTPSKRKRHNIRDPIALEARENSLIVTSETLVEYKWPSNDQSAETYMIQEQVSSFLDILSFKRKYPDLERRTVEKDERSYLLETFPLFTCTHFDMGLTAIKSEQLHDLMMKDYPDKFKDFASVLRKREQRKFNENNKGIGNLKNDADKLQEYTKSAAKSASDFNAFLMRERRLERMAYFDLQTSEVHYPSNKWRKLTAQETRVGKYPVALIAGQYSDNIKKYTPLELLHLPLGSARVVRPAPRVDPPPTPPPPSTPSPTPATAVKNSSSTTSCQKLAQDDSQAAHSCRVQLPTLKTDQSETTTDSDLPLKPSPTQTLRRKQLTTRSRRNATVETPSSKRKVRSDKGLSRRMKASMDDNLAETGGDCPTSAAGSASCLSSTSQQQQQQTLGDVGHQAMVYPRIPCNICMQTAEQKYEDLVMCVECERLAHPSCLQLTKEMVPMISTYKWQCMECKLCFKCQAPHDEEKMMFCDHCDRGYHTYCVNVSSIPVGRWDCPHCTQTKPKISESQARRTRQK